MLILKSQALSDKALIELAASMSSQAGELMQKLLHWDFGPLMNMKYDAASANYLFSSECVPYHWDGAFFKEPRQLLFYCTSSEGEGGETIFADTEKIWESLSESDQNLCRKVELIYRTEKLSHYGGEIRVPLVQKHPVTGKTILRMAERVETKLNPVSLEIVGIPKGEELYQFLRAKLYQAEFMYEHVWEPGDLLVCDNFTYLHGRRELRNNKSRSFKRIQIL